MARTCHRFVDGVVLSCAAHDLSVRLQASAMTSAEHEEQHRLYRMGPALLSAMQCFTAVTASVPRFLFGRIESAEEGVSVAAWVIAAFSPILLLYLARRAGFLLGLLAVAIVPIFFARLH